MNLSFLNSPTKPSKELVVKVLFISIAVIIFVIIFGPRGEEHGFSANVASAPTMGSFASKSVSAPMMAQDAVYTESVGGSMRILPPEYGGGAGSPDFPAERKVIRNASLSLVVEDVSASAKNMSDLAVRMNGWVESQNVYEYTAGALQGSLTLRVPEAKFGETLSQLKLLAVRVQNEQISSSDVSAQVVDLESRLKNERAKEAQYILILKDARKISDILEVTNALSGVRGQIEQIEGQINYLARQTSMSTITASLTPVANAKEVTNDWSPLLIVKESFRNLLFSLTGLVGGLIVFVIQVLPVLILQLAFIVIILGLLWKVGKKIIARMSTKPQ